MGSNPGVGIKMVIKNMFEKVTRVEVIGDKRLLVLYDLHDVKLSIQDNYRTLKVFVKQNAAIAQQ